jgi:hypothetical protein
LLAFGRAEPTIKICFVISRRSAKSRNKGKREFHSAEGEKRTRESPRY